MHKFSLSKNRAASGKFSVLVLCAALASFYMNCSKGMVANVEDGFSGSPTDKGSSEGVKSEIFFISIRQINSNSVVDGRINIEKLNVRTGAVEQSQAIAPTNAVDAGLYSPHADTAKRDLDADGYPDFVVSFYMGSPTSSNQSYSGKSLERIQQQRPPLELMKQSYVDMNGDGTLEYFTLSSDRLHFSIGDLRGTLAQGQLSRAAPPSSTTAELFLTISDIDKDGISDFAVISGVNSEDSLIDFYSSKRILQGKTTPERSIFPPAGLQWFYLTQDHGFYGSHSFVSSNHQAVLLLQTTTAVTASDFSWFTISGTTFNNLTVSLFRPRGLPTTNGFSFLTDGNIGDFDGDGTEDLFFLFSATGASVNDSYGIFSFSKNEVIFQSPYSNAEMLALNGAKIVKKSR